MKSKIHRCRVCKLVNSKRKFNYDANLDDKNSMLFQKKKKKVITIRINQGKLIICDMNKNRKCLNLQKKKKKKKNCVHHINR